MRPVILIVANGVTSDSTLRSELEYGGFDILEVRNSDEALSLIEQRTIDLILLKLISTEDSGLAICRRVRLESSRNGPPIVILTARATRSDRVHGLDVGADDFLVEPYSIEELTARILAILRRSHPSLDNERLKLGDLEMNITTHRVTFDGHFVRLGPTEFRLLRFLMENPGRVFSRSQLIDNVWGDNIHIGARTVDVHIRHLRKALNRPDAAGYIRTVRAVGYAIDNPAPDPRRERAERAPDDPRGQIQRTL